jgi:NTE family protein
MSRVGLVLGGGGITGAAYHLGAVLALEMATGWNPDDAEVVVGTSSGAVVAGIIRAGNLSLESLIGDAEGHAELATTLAATIYRRTRPRGVIRWIRHGLAPGLRHPGLQLAVGSPARFTTAGMEEWLENRIGDLAHRWPSKPTIIPAYDIAARSRVAFGTEGSPDTTLARAAAASSAVPMVFAPVEIDGRLYVDGGLASGTSADLVLGAHPPLDLVIVSAPMASNEARRKARLYESVLDRVGMAALDSELERIREVWPDCEVIVLRPDADVLEETRPNPLGTHHAVPAFLETLRSMRLRLAEPEVWRLLDAHLVAAGHR